MENYMKEELLRKIELIKKINTDDSNFIIKVCETYLSNNENIKNQKEETEIILKSHLTHVNSNIIDLDKIWTSPYFYTRMRIQLEGIIKQILDIDKNKILKNPSTYCKEVIFHNAKKNFVKPEHTIDIVDFIHELDKQPDLSKKNNFTFIAEEINAETLFKEEQLKKAIEIINITDAKNRIKKIYEYIYNYLKKDFVENRYCDFKKNKCVAQRHFTIYPINRKNGCCFTKIRKCPHLEKGECKVECVACRLYSCPYLTKRGIGYYGNEFILLKAFYTKKQRHNLIFKFYKPKEKVLEKLFSLKTKQIDT